MFTLLLALVSVTALQSAGLQTRMAGNALMQLQARQQAQAIVDEVLSVPGNFDLSRHVGWRSCLAHSGMPDCDDYSLSPPNVVPIESGSELALRVMRINPPLIELPPAYPGEEGVPQWAALFEVSVAVGGGGAGPANGRVIAGVAVPQGGGAVLPVYWREPGVDAL
ncbi:MAG: hypothetical protein R3E54_00100 [Halioglobus sp.]